MSDDVKVGRPVQLAQALAGDSPAFVADPVAYILLHACVLHAEIESGANDEPGAVMGRTYNSHATAIAKGTRYGPLANARLTGKLYAPSAGTFNLPTIKIAHGANGREFAFLPWKEDRCTATTLFGSARIFMTGPLSGCNIYVGDKAGYWPLVLHANSNASADNKAHNIIAKDNDAINIATGLGYTLTHRLARGDYEIPAFVWGKRSGKNWAFFVHSVDVSHGTATNTPLRLI